METPFFFKNNKYNLFGILHEPDVCTSPLHPAPCTLKNTGIVFCHPFAEEKLIAHRVMVNWARALSAEGYHVLRFDYMGHGDSEGNFEDATIETMLSDIRRALLCLKERANVEKFGLLGVRFGATLAALVAEGDTSIDFLILIAPIIKGEPYIDHYLRSNLTTQMTIYRTISTTREQLKDNLLRGEMVNIEGYLLSRNVYLQMKDLDLLKQIGNFKKKLLIVQLAKQEHEPLPPALQELYSICLHNGCSVSIDTVKEDSLWAESKLYNPHATNTLRAMLQFLNHTIATRTK